MSTVETGGSIRIISDQVGAEQGELKVNLLPGQWIEMETDGGTGDPQSITFHQDEFIEMVAFVFKKRPEFQREIIAKCIPGLSKQFGGIQI